MIDSKRAGEESRDVAKALTELLAAVETVPPEAVALSLSDEEPPTPTQTDAPPASTQTDAPTAAPAPEMPALWSGGVAYLGVLSIPALDISLPIRYDYDYAAGTVHRYTVAKAETLEPWQVTEMLESGCALTLYTCTIGGQHRVTVRCTRSD